jgi:hypothetical protein
MKGFGRAMGRGEIAASAFACAALAVLSLAVFTNVRPQFVAPMTAFLVVMMLAWRTILGWRSLVTITILLIFLVPIKRYEVPASLPFKLEPYRIFIAFAALGWVGSLLADPRVRLRKSGLEAPFVLVGIAIIGSLLTNPERVSSLSGEVEKSLIFFASFFIVFYLIVSSIRQFRDVEIVVKWLVATAAVVGFFALIEQRTAYNVFNHLASFLPLRLDPQGLPPVDSRGGRLRVAASAAHPIELGSTLALVVPLALYLVATTRQLRWGLAGVLIAVAMFSTGSRTAVIMLLVVVITLVRYRPREMKRLWPALLPLLLVIHFAAPGTIGSLKQSFFPEGGLIAEQQNAPVGHARLSTLGPTLSNEWAPHPIFGLGFATRVTTPTVEVPEPNAPILDNQWLGILAETGLAGAIAFGWMFVRYLRRTGAAIRSDRTQRGGLLLATSASVAAYAVGMLTFDAFSFNQVTFLLFIILGLGCSARRAQEGDAVPATARRGLPRPVPSGPPPLTAPGGTAV